MAKYFLPVGLMVGALTLTSLVSSTLLNPPSSSLVRAQQSAPSEREMTPQALEQILREMAGDVEVNQNQIAFTFEEQSLLLVTDTEADRMRIITPIIPVEDLSADNMAKMMLANFHTALDGRYAISNGVVYAAFIHPLSSLQADDFRSAVSQVSSLATTFGDTYSSGNSLFGAPAQAPTSTESLPAI